MKIYSLSSFVLDLFFITQAVFWIDTIIECIKATL